MDKSQPSRTKSNPGDARRLKILFTEGSSLSARQSLYCLQEGEHTIDVLDPNPLCQCRFSSFVRRWTRCPNFAREPVAFLRCLVERLREESYDVVFPTHEQTYLLSRFREEISRESAIALPDFQAMRQVQNKADFTRLLAEMGLPHPDTEIVTLEQLLSGDWRYPLYLKLSHGTAGQGVFLVENARVMSELSDTFSKGKSVGAGSEILLQQPAVGVQSTAQIVFQHGRIVAIHFFEARAIGVGGMSSARVSADHPIVREHMELLGRRLDWHGAMFVDYFYDHQRQMPQYIECNPRVGESVSSWLSGVNICEALLRVSCDEDVSTFGRATTGVRTQSFYMILMTIALNGGGRWRLLQELFAAGLGRGIYADSQDDLTRPSDDRWSLIPICWIAAQLLAWPGRAKSLVAKTVDDYSMPEAATTAIDDLPEDLEQTMADREYVTTST